jgi:hypothetical protein
VLIRYLLQYLHVLTINKHLISHVLEEIDAHSPLCLLGSGGVRLRYPILHAGHKPPAFTDTPPGRYAGALFSAASKTSVLQIVASDLTNLGAIIKESEPFR